MIDLGKILLRKFEPRDIEALYSFRNDPEVTSHLGGFSFGFSKQDVADWIDNVRRDRSRMMWAIAGKAKDLCIGQVGLYGIDHRTAKAEFAILVGDSAWRGKGVGKAAAAAVLRYGFEQLNLHKIWLTVLEGNEAAIGMYKSLGFQQDGVLRDEQFRDGHYLNALLMSILHDEWRNGRNARTDK